MRPVRVSVCALDPITKAGMADLLEARPSVTVVEDRARDETEVVVAAFDRLSADATTALRAVTAEFGRPIVLVTDRIEEGGLAVAVACRVVAILPRSAMTESRVADSVRAAASGAVSPPRDLLGRLAEHAERLRREMLAPNGPAGATLSSREIDVLRLMADGFDTHEIATELAYSERTVKNVIYAVTDRLRLRNRSHAVAYAIREGVI
ncbi:DNA-binding response regulator, NarL/FixJ family, contains REC and HTH domains [Amycolatopsis lurida]|uniref:LuxR family transcriptional regulator n=2 Tax=Amycolatopsis lurida TaxID=31959 RepID=A0A2P2FFW9_AMYLU|nr:LuxR family transcriptional regulator [Amycolatopsis lurida NRRL 2430]SEE56864.1 DNA-binding response regulator, NarL/FixJ family, contains REC and HTH domains [Amycolatopsis lurida]